MKRIIFILFLIIGIVYGATINESESNNNYTEANNISINDIGIGSLHVSSSSDYDIDDWWTFTTPVAGTLHIYTTGATKNINAKLYDNNLIAADYDNNNNINITTHVTKNTTYYLDLYYYEGYWSWGSFYYYIGSTDYQLHFDFTPDPADANDDSYKGLTNESVSGNVLDNDDGYNITVTSHTNPSYGTLTIHSDGSFTYTPSSGWTGTDSFTYTITDGSGNTDTATVSIEIADYFTSKNERDFTLRKKFDIHGDYKMVGNGVLCWKNGGDSCVETTARNNDKTLSYINKLGTNTITINGQNVNVINASKANISGIPDDANITFVGFYTQGDRTDETEDGLITKLLTNPSYLIAPNGDKYEIKPTQVDVYTFGTSVRPFSTFAEVKSLEGKKGSYFNGWWTGVNIQAQQGYNSNLGYFGAWNMVVIYKYKGLHLKNISVFDGYKFVHNESGYNNVEIPVSGFLTPMHGDVNSTVSVFVGEGDYDIPEDKLYLKGTTTDYENVNKDTDKESNAFDSSVNGFATNPDKTNKFGIDIHNYNVGTDGLNIIKNGDTSATLKFYSDGDAYYPSVFVFSTDLYEPRVCYYIDTIKDEDGETVFKDGGFGENKIDPSKEYNITIWISNIKKHGDTSEDYEDAYKVRVKMKMYDFNYTNQTTFIKNTDWTQYYHQTDELDTDAHELFNYLSDENISYFNVGDGATSTEGGYIPYFTDFNDANKTYINFRGKFDIPSNSQSIDINDTFKFSASYQIQGGHNFNDMQIYPCENLNMVAGIYTPNPGSFNVVETSFSSSSDPTDVNDTLNQIYTKITNKIFYMKVLKLSSSNYQSLENFNGMVAVDVIKNPTDESECASNSAIIEQYVPMSNVSNEEFNVTVPQTVSDARFRVKYLVKSNGDFIDTSCLAPNSGNTNYACIWGILEQIWANRGGNDCTTANVQKSTCTATCADKCSYYRLQNGQDKDTTIPSDNCLECVFGNYSKSVCSRDDFAVRPDKYGIKPLSIQKYIAGQDVNITVQALDYYGNVISDFNFTNAPVDVNISDAMGCRTDPTYTPHGQTTVNFINGEANLTINYKEAGDINISVKEYKNGNEFAKVDENDSISSGGVESDDDLLIGEGNSTISRFYPDHFAVSGSYNNPANGTFTYLSNDLNMSAELNLTITAKNEDNGTTQNYNRDCYAKNFDLNISYDDLNTSNVPNTIRYELNSTQYSTGTNSDLNFTNLSKDFFGTDNNGTANFAVKINFDKNYTNPIEEFNMTVRDVNVSDVNGTFGKHDINDSVRFIYGRIKVSNAAAYSSDINTTFEYQYWSNDGWVINTDHNNSAAVYFGDVNTSITNPLLPNGVSITLNQVSGGKESVKFSLNTAVQALPYSAKIHLAIDSWLWYHPLAKDYKDPSATNTDCLTHPCMKVDFLKSGSAWGGVQAVNNSAYTEENRTSEMNVSAPDVNVSKSQVKKINW
jgi:VCBS repeat-containing protein